MEDIKIITIQPTDWEQYREIRLRALKEEPQAFASTYAENVDKPAQMWIDRLNEALVGQNQWLLFAQNNNSLVGMIGAFIKEDSTVPEVIAVYVIKEWRGQGIGKLLLDKLITTIKQNQSINKLHLEVNCNQLAAINLYKSCGFSIIGKSKKTLGDGIEYEDYQMELVL